MDEVEEGVVTIYFPGVGWLVRGRKPAEWNGGGDLALLRVQQLNRPATLPGYDGIRAPILLFARDGCCLYSQNTRTEFG